MESANCYRENAPLLPNEDAIKEHLFTQTLRSDTSSLATLVTDAQISDARRTFCLFVLFDLLITAVLWLVACGTSVTGSQTFITILTQQISHYTYDTSLFDVLMLAVVRFCFLEVSYAVAQLKHWWPVAVSTGLCDVAFITKIFLVFIYGSKLNTPMTVVLLVADFVITWIEVWFLDSKVLPSEMKIARRTVQAFLQQSYQSTDNAPPSYFRPAINTPWSMPATSYYSPTGSASSDVYNEQQGSSISEYDHIVTTQTKYAMDEFFKIVNNEYEWTMEKSSNGDVVHSCEHPRYGKTFQLTATIDEFSTSYIFKEVLSRVEEFPLWNPSVSSVQIIKSFDNDILLTLETSAPAALGLIASRDFVTIRRTMINNDVYIGVGMSTDSFDNIILPSNNIRGFNGPSGFMLKPGPTSNSSELCWILNTNLKGNLSRSLVNSNLTSTMFGFSTYLRKRLNNK